MTIEQIKEKLNSEDHNLRIEACEELIEYPDDAIDILIETFHDKNPLVRFQAAKSLSEIGDDSIKPLINTLKDNDDTITQKYVIPVSYTHLTLPTTLCMCRSRWSPYH